MRYIALSSIHISDKAQYSNFNYLKNDFKLIITFIKLNGMEMQRKWTRHKAKQPICLRIVNFIMFHRHAEY